MIKKNTNHQQNGYIALMTVVIISAVAIAISTTVALTSIGEAQSSLALSEGDEALFLTEGCMEDALQKAWADASYAGGTITRPEGTCNITVSKAGSVWTITAQTTATQYRRTIQVIMNRGASISIQSWNEL